MAAEVVSQLMHICRREDAHTDRAREEIASFDNIVFMGMGEPLANLPNLLKAIEIITSPWGLHIGARHLTISTSGLVPQIRKWKRELLAWPRGDRAAKVIQRM